MPVKVPEESKTFTTIYDGFRGVDYTNDPSNVWKKRSPSGKNMLPDLDSRPFKRSGWKIELTADDFRTAAGVEGADVVPDKVYYFELGGYDHFIIFNNLGVFSYTTDPNGTSDSMILRYHNTYINTSGSSQGFPPLMQDTDHNPHRVIDARRAFFFEGKGKAGFYIFVGLKLFRYDGEQLVEEEPYIPTTLFACDPSGAGTTLESVNMLTRYRTVRYLCDGTTKTFTLPGGLYNGSTSSILKCEKLQANGTWTSTAIESATATSVTLQFVPPVTVEGEDNLRITYLPSVVNDTITVDSVTQPQKTVTLIRHIRQIRQKTDGVVNEWVNAGLSYEAHGVVFDTSNILTSPTYEKEISYECYDADTDAWEAITQDAFTSRWSAYSNSVLVEPNNNIVGQGAYEKTNVTKTGSPTEWRPYASDTYIQEREITVTTTYDIRIVYNRYGYQSNNSIMAFSQCGRALVFGSGIVNQVFMSASPSKNYTSRVWYSAATDPTYFPDTNYIEAGASDTPIMGMMKVGQYLGIVKKSIFIDTSIYLAYPTSFDDSTTYAVKQSINGIGAIAHGAFNTLNEEPVFLSKTGVMGIDANNDERTVRSRSHFINGKLRQEPNLEMAVSFVHDGMYWLAVNNRCYVLDGDQKSSWANTKTNLQYECYYLENIPAQCFAKMHEELWFTDYKGNLCKFKNHSDENQYVDDYTTLETDWVLSEPVENGRFDVHNVTGDGNKQYHLVDSEFNNLTDEQSRRYIILASMASAGDTARYQNTYYTVMDVDGDFAIVEEGIPIDAVWSTLADDDGMVHYFKNLKKKGCVISLLPASDSGVEVYVKPDSKDAILVGTTDAKDYELPFEFFSKKKIKKYKRLQFICRNNVYGDAFGLDQIVKTYTVGNYSKRR